MGAMFRAERVKLRKSWPMLTAILAPVCQTAFLAVLFWFSGSRFQLFKPVFRFWIELNYMAWSLVLMPVTAALLCDLSWEQERQAKAWNLLLIQPVPRRAHYLVKCISHLALLMLSQVLFLLLLPVAGGILQFQRDLMMGPLPLALLFRFAAFSALASVALVSFHTWLSMRVPSLWAALTIALMGSWLTLRWVGGSPLIQFLPWGLASQMVVIFDRFRTLPWAYCLGSLSSSAVLVVLGTIDFARDRETRA